MRGRVKINLGGASHALAPTFEAFGEIESALESSISRVYVAHAMGQLQLSELAQIVAIGMNAAKPNSAEPEHVAKRLFEIGAASDAARRPIGQYLLALAYAPEEAKKKFEAEWPAIEAPPLDKAKS